MELKNMKKLISLILALSLFSSIALADCDFETGVTSLPDGGFRYSKECNLRVGQLFQDNKTKTVQIADLTKALSLKDLALKASDERAQMWMNSSIKLENNVSKIDDLQKKNEILYFAMGVVFTGAAVWGASQLVRK
jgi:hypothetical protein